MDQHPAMMAMAAQRRTRDIAADVATLGQGSTPPTLRGLPGFLAALHRGPRPETAPRPLRAAATPAAPAR